MAQNTNPKNAFETSILKLFPNLRGANELRQPFCKQKFSRKNWNGAPALVVILIIHITYIPFQLVFF